MTCLKKYGLYSSQCANIVSTTDYVSLKVDVCKKDSILVAIVQYWRVTIKNMNQCHRLQINHFHVTNDMFKKQRKICS